MTGRAGWFAAAIGVLAAVHGGCGGDAASTGSGGAASTGSASGGGGPGAGGGGGSSTRASTGASATGGGGAGGGAPSGTPFAYVGCNDGKIRVYAFDAVSGALNAVDETDAGTTPSFLAFSPDLRFVYAVDEGTNQLQSFSIDPATGKLTFLNAVSSNGVDPAHVAVDPTGKFVFGVNYGDGKVTTIQRQNDGSLGSTVATRDTGANAHEIVFDRSHRHAFVPDKGSDYVSQFSFDAATGALAPNAAPHVDFPAGSGPRHLAFHPSLPFAYVIDELDDTMVALAYDAPTGTLSRIQSLSTIPSGFDGSMNTGAEVAIDKSGRYLYGSNRGHDSIVSYSIDQTTGKMTLLGFEPSGGATPRHFSIEPTGAVLLVANQDSNNLVTFSIDAGSGALSQLLVTNLPAGPEYVGVVYLNP